jgi:hypothetical protein
MTGDMKCPACVIRTVHLPSAGSYDDPSCTGRPGCVRTAPVPPVPAGGVDSGATPIMPDGWEQNAQPTDPLLVALSMGMKVGPAVAQQAADEIARLRAEVERLNKLALKLDTANSDLTAGIVRQQADRAAFATRVAEKVREAVASEFDRRADIVEKLEAQLLQANEPVHRDTVRNLQRYAQVARWVDIAPIVAAALAKEGE